MREVKRRRTSGLANRRNTEQSKRDTDTRQNRSTFNGHFSKSQGYALAISILVFSTLIFGAWATSPGTQHIPPCNDYSVHYQTLQGKTINCPHDPTTYLSQSVNSLNPICSDYNMYLGSCLAKSQNGHNAPGTLTLAENSTDTAVALAKSPIDMSITASKQIWGLFGYTLSNTPVGANVLYGIYLTTNKTLPGHQAAYDPRKDPGTAFMLAFSYTGAGTVYNMYEFVQRTPTTNIFDDSQGHACSTASALWLCQTFNKDASANWIEPSFILNYTSRTTGGTGCTAAQGDGCSNMEEFSTTTFTATQQVPLFPFRTTGLYLGFYAMNGLSSGVYWTLDDGSTPSNCVFECNQLLLYQPAPTTVTAPANLDVGAFFSPGLSVLWNGLTFLGGTFLTGVQGGANILNQVGLGPAVYSGLSYFFSFIIHGLQSILNSIGTTFGLGNIGDQLVAFFGGIVNWLSNVFGSSIAQIGNIANGFSSGVAALGNIFTGWGVFIVNSLGVIGNLPTILLTVWNDFLPAAYAVSFIILLWWVFGTYQAWRDFNSGDFAAILPVALMFGTLLLWLGSSVAFNPISANTTVTSAYNTAFNQISWFFTILIPVFLVVMFKNMGSPEEDTRHKNLEHFTTWVNVTALFITKLYTISFLVAKESWTIIISIKTMVSGWL